MEELHALVSGRVQGVMFRDFTQRKARRLGLVGWVKNLPDGRVELVAHGERKALESLLGFVRRGSLFSHVERVETQWGSAQEKHPDFRIRLD